MTFIDEDTPLNLAENGLYEISYINTEEEDIVYELELLNSVTNDDSSGKFSR